MPFCRHDDAVPLFFFDKAVDGLPAGTRYLAHADFQSV